MLNPEHISQYLKLIAEELNVKEVIWKPPLTGDGEQIEFIYVLKDDYLFLKCGDRQALI